MSSQARFIHLRLHTEYSLLEGAVRLKKLPKLCTDASMPAVAVTDTNNMFSALEFFRLCKRGGDTADYGLSGGFWSGVDGARRKKRSPLRRSFLLAQKRTRLRKT